MQINQQFKIEQEKYSSANTLFELEGLLQSFIRGFSPYMELIPPLPDEVGYEPFPEYCYIGTPMRHGSEFAIAVYLKEGLTLRSIVFYYDLINLEYIKDFIFLTYFHYDRIVNLVEVIHGDQKSKWSITVEQVNRLNH